MLETRQINHRNERIEPFEQREANYQMAEIQQLLDRLVLSSLGVTTLAIVLLLVLGGG